MKQINCLEATICQNSHKKQIISIGWYVLKKWNPQVKNLKNKQTFRPNGFTGKFYQTLKKQIALFLYNLFQQTEGKGKEHFPTHFMRLGLP